MEKDNRHSQTVATVATPFSVSQMSNNAYGAPKLVITAPQSCYAKSNLSPQEPLPVVAFLFTSIRPSIGGNVGQLSRVLCAYLRRPCCTCTFVRSFFTFPITYARFYYPPLNPSLPPYVSHPPYFHIVQLPANFRQCLESVPKTHEERSSHAPAR